MKSVTATIALLCLLVLAPLGAAQEKSNPPEKAKPITPVRVKVNLMEFDGEKKIASLPYSFLVNSEPGGSATYSTFTRVGVRVPVAAGGKEGQSTFMDVGSNIDCGVRTEEDGRFLVRLNVERSSLYFQGRGEEKGTVKTTDAGLPYVPTMRAQSLLVLLKDGQTLEVLAVADPLNGHVFRIEVTLNVQK